jgi:hypothetical protein
MVSVESPLTAARGQGDQGPVDQGRVADELAAHAERRVADHETAGGLDAQVPARRAGRGVGLAQAGQLVGEPDLGGRPLHGVGGFGDVNNHGCLTLCLHWHALLALTGEAVIRCGRVRSVQAVMP